MNYKFVLMKNIHLATRVRVCVRACACLCVCLSATNL